MRGQRLSAEIKQSLLEGIDQAQAQGMKVTRACQILDLPRSRYYAWKKRLSEGPGLADTALTDRPAGPDPGTSPHRLLDEEKEIIQDLLSEETYADLSIPQLAIVASEEKKVQASASSFYRQAQQQKGNRDREEKHPLKKQDKPEVHATAPHQVWAWDLSYIPFFGMYLYLVAILDVYSRKIVGWKLCFHANVDSVKQAWDQALANEGLLDRPDGPQGLEALSDHGSQMTAKSMKKFFQKLDIDQLFARYQTPTDNAWIEVWFRILKYEWLRFQDVLSFHQLEALMGEFITYYNERRYHGAIGYVTPQQRHTGQDEEIIHHRQQRKEAARQRRLTTHQKQGEQAADQGLEKAA